MAIDIFYEAIVEFFEEIPKMTPPEKLHTELTEENATSDYCTWYLRVLAGTTFLKPDRTRFLPYLLGKTDTWTLQRTVKPRLNLWKRNVPIMVSVLPLAVGPASKERFGTAKESFRPTQLVY